jgi:hypothetical protein
MPCWAMLLMAAHAQICMLEDNKKSTHTNHYHDYYRYHNIIKCVLFDSAKLNLERGDSTRLLTFELKYHHYRYYQH